MRRGVVALLAAVLVLALAAPAGAAQLVGTDTEGDVPFRRGDIVNFRVLHGNTHVDLRLRTDRGGSPVNVWPNRQTMIRWRIDTELTPGPEFAADLFIDRGEDTVFLGRVVDLSDHSTTCTAQQFVNGPSTVRNDRTLYAIRFPDDCIGDPAAIRVRATFRWNPGAPGGASVTDFAPNGGPTTPVAEPV
jgi:hypothetical protein